MKSTRERLSGMLRQCTVHQCGKAQVDIKCAHGVEEDDVRVI